MKQLQETGNVADILSLRQLIVIGSVFLFAILLITWYSLNQVEERLRHQAVDTLELVLESTHDNLHQVWLDGLLKDAALWVSDPRLVTYVENLLELPREREVLINSIAQENIRDYFRDILKRHDALGIFIIGPDHVNLGSMRDVNIGVTNLIADHQPPRLEKVFNGKSQFIPPIPSDVPLPFV